MTTSLTISKPVRRLSVRTQTLAGASALIGAVALPQIFHMLGRISGLGNVPGEVFLPMHLPIILVGLLAGSYAGAVAGLLSPLVSFLLSGMPGTAMLPFMMLELCVYGLTAGLLRSTKIPVIGRVLIIQVAGRAVRAVAIIAAFYLLGSRSIAPAVIWNSIVTGVCGIVMQWILIPLIIYRVEHEENEK